jgi:hypothetical protein
MKEPALGSAAPGRRPVDAVHAPARGERGRKAGAGPTPSHRRDWGLGGRRRRLPHTGATPRRGAGASRSAGDDGGGGAGRVMARRRDRSREGDGVFFLPVRVGEGSGCPRNLDITRCKKID